MVKEIEKKEVVKEKQTESKEVNENPLNIYQKLNRVQVELKAPKNQWNDYSNYHYRSLEDINEGLKPLLDKYELVVILRDEIVVIGDRYYLKAIVTLIDPETQDKIETEAFAREEDKKTGMDGSQLTGATSSYARKYAMNAMFAIDDTKDADARNNKTEGKNRQSSKGKKSTKTSGKILTDAQIKRLYAIAYSKDLGFEKVNEQVMTTFGKKVEDLTREEYERVCKGYESMEA